MNLSGYLLVILSAHAAYADQVVMKNGDRLSGVIQKFDGKALIIKSEFAGAVTIAWDAVTEVISDKTIFVGLKDGQTVAGTVTMRDGKLTVTTKETGTITAAMDAVASIRNPEEQQLYETQVERYRNPHLLDLWTGFVDLGYAQSAGNSVTSTITTSANAVRATSRDKISTYFTSIYAKNNTSGTSLLTANAMRGGIAYNLDVSGKAYAFGSTDLEFDEFQRLDLRFVPAGGGGYHVVKSANTIFDLFGGGAYNREFYSTGLRRSSGELLMGDELNKRLFGGMTTVRQKLVIYPNLSDTGQYRINFDLSQATTLRKWLAWQVTVSNRFISNPAPGRKTNDILVTTGFRITFAR